MDIGERANEPPEKPRRASAYEAPTIKFGRKSTYQANYTEKPVIFFVLKLVGFILPGN